MSQTARALLACAFVAVMLLSEAAAAHGLAAYTAATSEDLLPDLQVEPLGDFRVQILDGRRIVRFTTSIANRGDGPLEIAATRTSTSTPDMAVVQHLYQRAGGYMPVPTRAVLRYSEEGRQRWKLRDAVEFALRMPGEDKPRVAQTVGLCLTDDTRLGGTSDAKYDGCVDGRPDARSVAEGISVDWGHLNRFYMGGQWIDITGLPLPGRYCVAATANPLGLLAEKLKDNNGASTLVDLTSNGVTVVSTGC